MASWEKVKKTQAAKLAVFSQKNEHNIANVDLIKKCQNEVSGVAILPKS